MKKIMLVVLWLGVSIIAYAQEAGYVTESDIAYYPESANQSDAYKSGRCVLDIYYPKGVKNFPTIVWFHGGGLTNGEKSIPETLKEKGAAVVTVNYRLSPKAKAPAYIEDAAAAVAWTFKNITKYGGNSSLIFISGHSAGGYLALMVGMDKKWLNVHGINANHIAGLIPFSGHTITHFTVREERGIKGTQPVIDDLAPLYHVRPDAPPLLLITGDREMELLGRQEENAYMMRMMKVAGHQDARLLELDGYGHNMAEPAFPLLLNEVKRILKRFDGLYPPKDLVVKYHNEWTRNHYQERINEFKNNPLNYGDIVFLGNSITEEGKDWAAKLGIPNVKNRGIGGDGTDGVLNRLDEFFHFKPKAIFLLIGINDLFNLHLKKEIPSAEYVGNNILKIVNLLSEKTPNTKIYVQTILPTGEKFMKENISKVNEMIKSQEKEGKYKVIDLYSILADDKGLMKKELTYDGTHLNDAGYKVWVDYIAKYVNQ